MRALAVEDEGRSVADIRAILEREGFADFKDSTIATFRGHAHAVLKLLRDAGRLKEPEA